MAERRRLRGEGSIYQRGDGLWVGLLNLGRIDGVRKRRAVYGKTETEVAKKLRAARKEWDRARATGNARLTVADWLTAWCDRLEADNSVAPLTLDNYRHKLGKVGQLLDRKRLDRLEAEHVREVYRVLGAEHALAYVVQVHRILAHAVKDAYLEGVVDRNVMERVKTPKVGRPPVKTRPMTPPEFLAMLPVIGGTRLESRWLLQNTLGLRQGEVLGLGWEDVDLDTGSITIRRALQRQRTGLTFVKPKSEASGETLPLPPLLWESMRTRYAVWLGEDHPDLSRYGGEHPHALVWGNDKGLPRDNSRDLKDWHAILEEAGVPKMGTHSGRHGLATLLASNHESVKMAQRLLRHADPALTLRTYTHTDDTQERRAITAAEQAWRSPGDA